MTETAQQGGSELTPDAAAVRLHQVLVELAPFEPCRGPVESWPEDLQRKRYPIWDLWPRAWRDVPPTRPRDTWYAYGQGIVARCSQDGTAALGGVASGAFTEEKKEALQRVLAARTTSVPEVVRATLRDTWRAQARVREAEPEAFLRNDWHERRLAVAQLLPEIQRLVTPAMRAVRQASGDENFVRDLRKDDLLHDETRDFAIRELLKVRAVVLADIERLGRAHKHERVATACRQGDVTELRSTWKDTADTLLRSNTGDDTRVDEYWHLRSLTSALATEAFRRKKARAALQKLDGILLTLMPREWYSLAATRSEVRNAIADALVEVEEVYLAAMRHTLITRDEADDLPRSRPARKSARRAKGRTRSKGPAARPTPTSDPPGGRAGVAAQPAVAKVDPMVRVNYREALRGRSDLGLPRTAKTTLTNWCKNPQTAADLGVNPNGKVAAQEPLVSGLMRLHAQKSDKRRPPQLRRQ